MQRSPGVGSPVEEIYDAEGFLYQICYSAEVGRTANKELLTQQIFVLIFVSTVQ